MEEIRAHKKRRMIIGLSVLGAIFVLIVALIIGCSVKTVDKVVNEGEYQRIEKRTIANSVSANGKIVAVNGEEVSRQQLGARVTSVYVKVGDSVSPGQAICQFDTSSIEEQIRSLRENIASANDGINSRYTDSSDRINEASNNRLMRIAAANERLDNARVDYFNAALDLENAKNNYNDYMLDPNHHTYDNEALNLQSIIDSKSMYVDSKRSSVEALEDALYEMQSYSETTYSDVSDSLYNNTNDLTASLESQLRDLEKSLAESTVRCTVGGTVTELNVKAGDNFTGNTVCVIESLNNLCIDAEVSETDIADVAVGMKVMIKTEATRDAELTGYVTYVSPKASGSSASSNLGSISNLIGMDVGSLGGSSSSGSSSSTYGVRISLNDQNDRLRLGMNAKISIITESVEDALCVPVDAVRDADDKSKYVEIATNYDEAKESDGKIAYDKKKVKVTTGLKGSYYIEIQGDIKVGDYVYVPAAEGDDSIDEIMNMMGSNAGV